MSRLCLSLVFFPFFFLPAFSEAQSLQAWNKQRADAFSAVCVEADPTFENHARIASGIGFKHWKSELLLEPEVTTSLEGDDEVCMCVMRMGAPNPNSLVQALGLTIYNEFGEAVRTKVAKNFFVDVTRSGVDVAIQFSSEELEGRIWVVGRVFSPRKCSR